MAEFLSHHDMDGLLREAAVLEFRPDGTCAWMAFPPCTMPKLPPGLDSAVDEIQGLLGLRALWVMINKLPPGCKVPEHTDAVKVTGKAHAVRYHLPIQCNERCGLRQDDGYDFVPTRGLWFGPIRYWAPHSVWNLGPEDRIHLVVDMEDA